MDRYKIAIIGEGNVGSHLKRALSETENEVSLISSRSIPSALSEMDVILLTVSDRAISTVAERIAEQTKGYQGVVAHTAGSVDMQILSPYFKNYGVFYPLQTFSKDIEIENYSSIPIFIEGSNQKTIDCLHSIATSTFKKIYELDSSRRKNLHLASVFSCNFVNALYGAAADILSEANLPFDAILPLIEQTAKKVSYKSPHRCQTGPAARGDINIITSQLHDLEGKTELQEIYKRLTQYIMNRADHEQNKL